MKRRRKYYFLFCAMAFAIAFLLGGCGRRESGAEADGDMAADGITSEEVQWEFREALLPDADTALRDVLKEGESSPVRMMYGLEGSTVYSAVWVEGGFWLQKLESPYREWENIFLSTEDWIDGGSIFSRQAVTGENGTLWFLARGVDGEEQMRGFLAKWTAQDGFQAEEVPQEQYDDRFHNNQLLYVDRQGHAWFSGGEEVWYFEDKFSEKKEFPGKGYVTCMAGNPGEDGKVYLAGSVESGDFTVWEGESGKTVFSVPDIYFGYTGKMAFSGEGEGWLCTNVGIWRFRAGEELLENRMPFQDKGYSVTEVYGISVREDGSPLAFVKDGEEYILLAGVRPAAGGQEAGDAGNGSNPGSTENAGVPGSQGGGDGDEMEDPFADSGEKTKLELAALFPSDYLRDAVVYFNRHNKDYEIVIREPAGRGEREDFQVRIQAEVGSGGGPDILAEDVMDLANAAEKGFLRDLAQDLAREREQMPENVRALGRKDEMCYGAPYMFSVITFAVDSDALGGRETWTAEEMMQYVRDSGAQEAVCNWTSPYLFENLARWTGLVDPERGVCRLDGPEAKELLEFAMEYGGKDSGKESGERIREGEAFALNWVMGGVVWCGHMEEWFQGRELYIGYPGDIPSSGNLIYESLLAVNQACAHPEGAVAFLQYMLGEETQDGLARDSAGRGVSGYPVTSDALEAMYVYAQDRQNSMEYARATGRERGLNPETLEKLKKLIESAKPVAEPDDYISEIIAEETPAYFAGQKSAEEVCGILQNRVRLYLDEGN